MKHLYIAISFLALTLLSACIEKYDLVMEDTDNEILVVEGQIVGNTMCEFILQRSFCKNEDYTQDGPRLVSNAIVQVICSNGEIFYADLYNNNHYYAYLGDLDPNETYHLRIDLPEEGAYESEPMHPLAAVNLIELSYTKTDDGQIQIRVTNDDPQGEMYYMWTYEECWEVNTPFVTEWAYDRKHNTIERLKQRIDRGWCQVAYHPLVLGSNLDYGNGAVRDYIIYTLSKDDNRFNTRYHTKVQQMSVTKGEYEYYKQMAAQSTQTGGIFTLMPAQLPTNIHNSQGLRTAGYIGVHLNTSEAQMYINSNEVGYRPSRIPEILPDSVVRKASSLESIYDKGYRIYQYDMFNERTRWTRPWCIDCRDPYWGASLKRPFFWEDK